MIVRPRDVETVDYSVLLQAENQMAQYVGSAVEPDTGFLSPNEDLGNFRELLRRSVGRISTTCRAKVDESDMSRRHCWKRTQTRKHFAASQKQN